MSVHNPGSAVWIRLQTLSGPFHHGLGDVRGKNLCARLSSREAQTTWPRGDIDNPHAGSNPAHHRESRRNALPRQELSDGFVLRCLHTINDHRSILVHAPMLWPTKLFGKATCQFVK
jgi:hypothetical protein